MSDQYFIVMCEKDYRFHRHNTMDAAQAEAKRLAEKENNKRFFVLQTTHVAAREFMPASISEVVGEPSA